MTTPGAPWDNAPWNNAFQVVGQGGQGSDTRGFTEPATQASAPVPSAAQDAPPEAGEGQIWDTGEQEFGEPGITGSVIMDTTPYEPPGVAPGVAWDAPPWVTEDVRSIDHGASEYFNSEVRPATGLMQTHDQVIPSWSRGITTDSYGRLDLTDINRPEHDISQTVQRDLSPRWVGYEERLQYLNIAIPAPVISGDNPSHATPDGTYPNLSSRGFAAEQYVSPPDPTVTDGTGTGITYEPQGDWE